MPRDSQATKASLLQAASDEFATYGIAGARVDRIAAAAGYNKNLIYVHFGSKEGLFDAVFARAVEELQNAVPITPDDLPGYAGALYDFYLTRPRLMRLARWHSLERPGALERLPVVVSSNSLKMRGLAGAQADGLVDAGLPPLQLLSLILSIAATWSPGSPEAFGEGDVSPEVIALRRHAVVLAVARLTRPPGDGDMASPRPSAARSD
ncbi:TetR family transcriptional regulator [Streptomyces sp. TS71-3]|uniref:TetR family transcriptional regulator n=1 Tax=Streptomyces sp. TS71-3 TaxID=2733862 RepID=UPI001B1BF006|nr:TetR family transcriptional regulator [Streptomyces sp. TS71-3]GHJ36207.1 putative TetR family regulatory protein [Streptomyces sp. TS71-3]